MKKVILGALIVINITSCAVQQFPVNTSVQPFQNGGRLIGEKTRGKTIKKNGDLFIFGINILNCDAKEMAEDIKATSYTIETKRNIVSATTFYFTGGIINYRVVKVIKRDN